MSTEFSFDAPTNNSEAIATGLDFFRKIADGLLFADEHIEMIEDQLRQEMLSKIKDRKDLEADWRLTSNIFPCSHNSTNFLGNHSKLDPQAVRTFYKDYYRPDLMAISIIGNIEDIDQVESEIKRNFAGFNGPQNPKKLNDCDSLYFSRPQQFYVVERQIDSSKVVPNDIVNFQFYYRDPATFYNLNNLFGLERLIMTDLLVEVLRMRFGEISKKNTTLRVLSDNLLEVKGSSVA